MKIKILKYVIIVCSFTYVIDMKTEQEEVTESSFNVNRIPS